MARERLGDEIDLHSGGEDNIFPHHECELAQSCSATGRDTFARLWFHPRFLIVEGEKMSKSKGNFFTPRDLFARGVEPAALRLELIKTHYRSNANFTEQGLKDSQRIIDRWRRLLSEAGGNGRAVAEPLLGSATREPSARTTHPALADFAAALHDDLNIAGALAAINTFTSDAKPTHETASVLRTVDAVLGLFDLERPAAAQTSIGVFADGLAPDPTVIAKLEARAAARAARDFKRSDAIRDELLAMGYAIKDVAGGKVEVRRA
jgi:cysteinyl-tRNA synthetase